MPRQRIPPTIGRFQILSELGSGSMGAVFRAHDPHLEREVALKQLHAPFRRDPERRARFIREARITAGLAHHSILPVYELGEHEGSPFLTMRLVEGETLRVALRRVKAGEPEALDTSQLLSRFIAICHGMALAHHHGVIHRDLKPSNLMLGRFGDSLVLDWGVARRLSDPDHSGALRGFDPATLGTGSQAGDVVGTLGYLSPEQARGQTADRRSDVWSLGAILYEILTWQRAVSGSTQVAVWYSTLSRAVDDPRTRAPDLRIPDDLAEVCLRALSVEPGQRYRDAGALARALEDCQAGHQRRERARGLRQRAESAWTQLGALREQRRRIERELQGLQERVPGWAPEGEKRPVMLARNQLRALQGQEVRLFGAVVDGAEQALGQDSSDPGSHALLARAYHQRLLAAEAEGRELDAAYYRERALHHDDGALRDQLAAPGTVVIDSVPSRAEVWVQPVLTEELRWQLGARRQLGRTPLQCTLPAGRYLLQIRSGRFQTTRYPIRLNRGGTWQGGAIPLRGADELGWDYAYVPGGPALLGEPARWVALPGFAIARAPVTALEWCRFLAILPPSEARQRAPRATAGLRQDDCHPLWPEPGPEGYGEALLTRAGWEQNWPVAGISRLDAQAYADHISTSTGLLHRLPTPDEWEKSARGADGRTLPWGEELEDGLANAAGSREGAPGPEPVGSFPADESVYGLRDLVGGVEEWTEGSEGELTVVCGGGWARSPQRLYQRQRVAPWQVSPQRGFRLVRALSPRAPG